MRAGDVDRLISILETGRACRARLVLASLPAEQQTCPLVAQAVRKYGHARQEGWHRRSGPQTGDRLVAVRRPASYQKVRRSSPKTKRPIFESLPLIRQGGPATGKIDGSLRPSSSLVAARAFQAPAYVNSDCGARAWAFDRTQVNALVRMVTAEAGMVRIGIRVRVGCPVRRYVNTQGNR